MYCYLCGWITDTRPSGLCVNCEEIVNRNNERVEMLAIFLEAMPFCPIHIQERMEVILKHAAPFLKLETHIKQDKL